MFRSIATKNSRLQLCAVNIFSHGQQNRSYKNKSPEDATIAAAKKKQAQAKAKAQLLANPIAKILHNKIGRSSGKGLAFKSADASRINIVSKKLCKDAIERLAPSLEKHKGCDLIDINPGSCVWSSSLHEHLKPRSHLLLEPDFLAYEDFYKPLLEKKGSTYKLIPESGIMWKTWGSVLKNHLPNQEPLARDDPRLNLPNNTLLFTANLGRVRRQHDRTVLSHMFIHQLMSAIRNHTIFQRYGLVRMLIWAEDIERMTLLPRVVSYRRKRVLEAEISCESIVEVASLVDSVGLHKREHHLELDRSIQVVEKMRNGPPMQNTNVEAETEVESTELTVGSDVEDRKNTTKDIVDGAKPTRFNGPVPGTNAVVRQDDDGVQWIAFRWSRKNDKYQVRCDIETVDTDKLTREFKTKNCLYRRAYCAKEEYDGNRFAYEAGCNTIAWALAELNTSLRGKRGVLQRAVDTWRNINLEFEFRSRRVQKIAKTNNKKKKPYMPCPIKTPEGRAATLQLQAQEILEKFGSYEEARKNTDSREFDIDRAYIKEMLELEAKVNSKEILEYDPSATGLTENLAEISAETPVKKGRRKGPRRTPEFLRYRELRHRLAYETSKYQRLLAHIAEYTSILAKEAGVRELPAAEAEARKEEIKRLWHEFRENFASWDFNYRDQFTFRVDDRLVYDKDPPVLYWDRRPFEPLLVQPEEFYPQSALCLLDCQPKAVEPVFRSPENWDHFEYLLFTFFSHPAQSVAEALETLAPGALEWIAKECPSLTDVTKGGSMDLESLRIRTMTQEQFKEILESWVNWPFKPDFTQIMARMGLDGRLSDFSRQE